MINDIVLELLRKCEGSLYFEVDWNVSVWSNSADYTGILVAYAHDIDPEVAIAEAYKLWQEHLNKPEMVLEKLLNA